MLVAVCCNRAILLSSSFCHVCVRVTPQSMLPPPAAAAMEALDMKKAMAILIAMDPNKAADVLTGGGLFCSRCRCCCGAVLAVCMATTYHCADCKHATSTTPLCDSILFCRITCTIKPTEMGAPQAANKLILMEADARNSIIESMAPRWDGLNACIELHKSVLQH